MNLRVLMFGWEFPPHNSGGLGVACFGLTKALTAENIDITFVLPTRIPVDAKFMKLAFASNKPINLKLRPVDLLLSAYITSSEYLQQRQFAGLVYGDNLFAEVARYALLAADIARTEQFDVIHAHDWLSFGAGVTAKQVSGKPLILHVHSTEYDRTGGNGVNDFVYNIEKTSMQAADCIIAVSQFTKHILIEKYGIPGGKIEVVHNGVEPEPRPNLEQSYALTQLKSTGTKIVLFVGRFTIQKGADKLIDAAAKVLHYLPDTLFLMVGAGDMENQLIMQAAQLGVSPNVVFTGFLRGDNKRKVYEAADVFVLPSVSEPFGLVALESLLHDTPVILTKQSGVSEVIHHSLQVDFWDVDQLANQLISALQFEPLRQTLAENGKQEAFNLTWKRAAERCKKIYTDLVG